MWNCRSQVQISLVSIYYFFNVHFVQQHEQASLTSFQSRINIFEFSTSSSGWMSFKIFHFVLRASDLDIVSKQEQVILGLQHSSGWVIISTVQCTCLLQWTRSRWQGHLWTRSRQRKSFALMYYKQVQPQWQTLYLCKHFSQVCDIQPDIAPVISRVCVSHYYYHHHHSAFTKETLNTFDHCPCRETNSFKEGASMQERFPISNRIPGISLQGGEKKK